MKDHHYNGGGGLKRFNDHFTNRWGNATDCKTSAHNALTAVDATLSVAQLQLITLAGVVAPGDYQNLPGGGDKLSNF
ncbi:hypothetical protein ABZ357_00980 [Streptomyces sp. NPDC005917]|uniref:hypothetical protein n=1 Tax=unclassified Streptomyces TaxID=2593676 RepID=UPI0033DEBC59